MTKDEAPKLSVFPNEVLEVIFSYCQTQAVRLCKTFSDIASRPRVRGAFLFNNWKKNKKEPYSDSRAYFFYRHASKHPEEMNHLFLLALQDPEEKDLAFFMSAVLGKFKEFSTLFEQIGYRIPFFDRKNDQESDEDYHPQFHQFHWMFYLIEGAADYPRAGEDISDDLAGLTTFAAFLGHVDIVKFLWSKGHHDRFALLGAVCSGKLDLVKFLYKNEAEWDSHITADFNELYGLTEFACIYGHLDILKFIYAEKLSSWLREDNPSMWTYTPLRLAQDAYGIHQDIDQDIVDFLIECMNEFDESDMNEFDESDMNEFDESDMNESDGSDVTQSERARS